MNENQKNALLDVASKLTMMGYALGQEINDSWESTDVKMSYDIAAELMELEAVLLTVPHKKG